MHYNQYITSGQTSYKLREHFSMMILSIVATVVLLGALFYHRVSLLLSSVILLARPRRSARPECGISGCCCLWRSYCCRLTLRLCVNP